MALWPFKPSTLLDADTMQWHVDIACWFLRYRGDTLPQSPARLILPAPGFYTKNGRGSYLGPKIFQQTKVFAGLADHAFELAANVSPTDPPTPQDPSVPLIAYSETLEKRPVQLIAWFARALARTVVDGIAEAPPCEPDQRVAAADVVASLLGFGVFLADDAIRDTRQAGVRHSIPAVVRNPDAVLSEIEYVVDLALFLTLHDLTSEDAARYLKPHLADRLKPALRDVAPFRDVLLAARARGTAGPRLIRARE